MYRPQCHGEPARFCMFIVPSLIDIALGRSDENQERLHATP